jgi:hypothetical protein
MENIKKAVGKQTVGFQQASNVIEDLIEANGVSTLHLSDLVKRRPTNSGRRMDNLDSIRSIGPSTVQELLYKAHFLGFSITEIPIVFVERQAGKSNLNWRKLVQGFLMVLKLRPFISLQNGRNLDRELMISWVSRIMPEGARDHSPAPSSEVLLFIMGG